MTDKKLNRRAFLQIGAAGIAATTLINTTANAEKTKNAFINPELEEITVVELQAKMRSGELTAKSLAEKYLARIKEIDPKINSVIELNPDALKIAEELDKERRKGKIRSPLHGIPVLIKDNIETADKMKTTAGSLALIDAPTPEKDAFIVRQLRKAGAVILGKTNLSEWANFRSTKSISGWSGRGGQTNNPYILKENPCGSSSGTGASISANLAAVGIGTETNGSIICPSLRCGLVGLKPTLGLVSRSGIIPIAHSQDTAGPMTRNVADATALLSVLVGADKLDAITGQSKNGQKDYTKFLNKDGLRGARIGVVRQFFGKNEKLKALIEPQFKMLEASGATLVDVTFPTVPNFSSDETSLLLYEFKADLNDYLARRKSKYKTLAELIKFNEENKATEMPLFGQELFVQAEAKSDLSTPEYQKILQNLKTATQKDGIDALVTNNKLDALVSPTVGNSWSIAAIAGYPSITVPAGMIDGIPAGMLFFGRAFSEPVLLKFAYAYEQMTKARTAPKFLSEK
jgi:amidase